MENKRPNTISIVGFVLSFVSGIAGFALSIIGLIQTKKYQEGGTCFAIAGIVISGIRIFVYILLIILFPIILVGIGEAIDEIEYYFDDYYYEANEIYEYDKCDYAYECKSYDKEYSICLYDNDLNNQEKIMCKK